MEEVEKRVNHLGNIENLPGNNSIRPKILIADDDEVSRKLMKSYLDGEDYIFMEAENGIETIRISTEHYPDIVLLDIMMPKLNGFEVCKILKSKNETVDIPVIMITSLKAYEDQIKGIKAGANDFLYKPIRRENLKFRVRNNLLLKKLHDNTKESYKKLKETEAMRDNLFHMVVHDLKQPITAIKGYLQLMEMESSISLQNKITNYIRDINEQTDSLLRIISSVLDINRLENEKLPLKQEEVDVQEIINEVIKSHRSRIENRNIDFVTESSDVTAYCDKELIYRVILNLFGNALKWTSQYGKISIRLKKDGNYLRIEIEDDGPGIPLEYQEKIFEKYWSKGNFQGNSIHSAGLGLAFCKLAVEANGGRIGVRSETSKGSIFWFTIPMSLQ